MHWETTTNVVSRILQHFPVYIVKLCTGKCVLHVISITVAPVPPLNGYERDIVANELNYIKYAFASA